jgi:tetratricopeptide (TPR) repeat protein
LLDRARATFEEQQDLPELDELFDDLATVYLLRGQPDLAEESATKSLETGGRANSNLGRGRSLLLMGRIAMARGDLKSASKHISDALVAFSTYANEMGQAEAHLALGDWHVDRRNRDRNPREAIAEYRKARWLEQKHEDRRGVARCHRKLAEVYMELNEPQRVEHALEDARESLAGIDDPRELAPLALMYGRLLMALDQHAEAIDELHTALDGFRQLGQEGECRRASQLLVASHHALDQMPEALECLREMGEASASIYNVLVQDLHPRIAHAVDAQFAAGEFKRAVREAFQQVEDAIRDRAASAGITSRPKQADLVPKLSAWLDSEADDVPQFRKPVAKARLAEFAKGAMEFLYFPAKHDEQVEFTPADAFAGLTTAHILLQLIEKGDLPWDDRLASRVRTQELSSENSSPGEAENT